MASIFTYDPDPPRVSSPWFVSEDGSTTTKSSRDSAGSGSLSHYGFKKLHAEPQDGPTEYKLHLLLRPRRAYLSMNTITSPQASTQSTGVRNVHDEKLLSPPLPLPMTLDAPSSSNQTRQERLKHLTTQLLWRLQQSSPFHASSSREIAVPRLPEDSSDLTSSIKLAPLVPGLEESRGALYEIGVSDDGTLVGLTEDETKESLDTLRIMAASLGCIVDVVRMVVVGDCAWEEPAGGTDNAGHMHRQAKKTGRLWVCEAFVTPHFVARDAHETECSTCHVGGGDGTMTAVPESQASLSRGSSATPQLRITLTGPTKSGKSTLLGTLSTGTLDNGRGKSRLSLLRHRHEMVSGVTSSVAQELVGYKHNSILNFSRGNIESWVDIHDCAENGRLAFLSDSGGHPRYRRTVLRGLMNWAPHWSILCIAADAAEAASSSRLDATSSTLDDLGAATASINLIRAHLNLALKLEAPLSVVVTKLDLASRRSLHETMMLILAAVKDAHRIPKILQPDQTQHENMRDITHIPYTDLEKVERLAECISESKSLTAYVPILLTSAVKGTGIGLVHALLSKLPLPPSPTSRDLVGMALNPEQPQCLFHIDDTFSLPTSFCALATGLRLRASEGVIVSGHLRFGSLSVGDKIVIGPFPPEDEELRGLRAAMGDQPSPYGDGLSISHPSSTELARIATENAVSAFSISGEWHQAQIVSIRNLRLPVHTLEAGQAGSVGVAFERWRSDDARNSITGMPRVRRGMVLAIPSKHMLEADVALQAASGFTAIFRDPDVLSLAAGSFVHVYVASVRAAARILRVSPLGAFLPTSVSALDDDIFGLRIDDKNTFVAKEDRDRWSGEVLLELLHNREWIEMGSKVLVSESGSQDRSGLEGYVGKVIEIID